MAYNSGKNISRLYVRENIVSPEVWEKNSSLLPLKSQMVDP